MEIIRHDGQWFRRMVAGEIIKENADIFGPTESGRYVSYSGCHGSPLHPDLIYLSWTPLEAKEINGSEYYRIWQGAEGRVEEGDMFFVFAGRYFLNVSVLIGHNLEDVPGLILGGLYRKLPAETLTIDGREYYELGPEDVAEKGTDRFKSPTDPGIYAKIGLSAGMKVKDIDPNYGPIYRPIPEDKEEPKPMEYEILKPITLEKMVEAGAEENCKDFQAFMLKNDFIKEKAKKYYLRIENPEVAIGEGPIQIIVEDENGEKVTAGSVFFLGSDGTATLMSSINPKIPLSLDKYGRVNIER